MEGARDSAAKGQDGFMLFSRDSLPDDRQRGYELMMEAAWEGDAKSANNVGWLLEHGSQESRVKSQESRVKGEELRVKGEESLGWRLPRDVKGALRWYERAADQGLPVGALNYLELLLNNRVEALGDELPDRKRLACAASLVGRAMLMGRGLPYDARKGEEMLLRGALFGDAEASETIAQQLEMYPDSFSYLDLAGIAVECDELLSPEERNIPEGMDSAEFAELMLTPQFWWKRNTMVLGLRMR